MWIPWRQTKSFLPVEVDFLNLCEHIVHSIEGLVNCGNLLNERQCLDLSSKLSKTTRNIRGLVFHCGASADLVRPALKNLYRYLEKAESLVKDCGEEEWCAASVFQIQNENAFREILLDVGLCYNAIYEQVKSMSEEWNALPEDLRQSPVFMPAPQSDVHKDRLEIQKRLEELASEHRVVVKQCLARYLLVKLNYTFNLSDASMLDTCSAILWAKETGPSETWGNSRFLGAGSGASGVCSTEWMGIPCAKKEFHGQETESFFLREAGILAHLKHPCIVNFICCGNGQQKGDRFIAMELMEKSLFDVIENQGDAHFSLPVVVDIMVQIARGMCYLHDQGVAHRDLKPQNVVVNRLTSTHLGDHFCVKLVDFGMSKTKVQVSKSNTISVRGVGTTNYRAPEVHPKAHPDGKGKAFWFKADVFSFAMTCAHALSLQKPFGETKLNALYKDLMNGRRPELPGDCPQELVAVVRDCWDPSPRFRPSFAEICTRLEAFRYKILRGFPTSVPSSLQDKSDVTSHEFIKVKIEEYSCIQRPIVATSGVEVETAMCIPGSDGALEFSTGESMASNLDPRITRPNVSKNIMTALGQASHPVSATMHARVSQLAPPNVPESSRAAKSMMQPDLFLSLGSMKHPSQNLNQNFKPNWVDWEMRLCIESPEQSMLESHQRGNLQFTTSSSPTRGALSHSLGIHQLDDTNSDCNNSTARLSRMDHGMQGLFKPWPQARILGLQRNGRTNQPLLIRWIDMVKLLPSLRSLGIHQLDDTNSNCNNSTARLSRMDHGMQGPFKSWRQAQILGLQRNGRTNQPLLIRWIDMVKLLPNLRSLEIHQLDDTNSDCNNSTATLSRIDHGIQGPFKSWRQAQILGLHRNGRTNHPLLIRWINMMKQLPNLQ